ncbi:required for drug-induced death protein 1 isoform X2 [Podarcis raffonei]|uniref:required for drug-induced death protein 1 isoform X2 n=1 Tax=Podarcis raffonei TaxID=65483 RepID=UPI0023292496|nr:required for drug-induced death protein 1 isoform X2 [Podarcis raffonei]
MLDFLDQLPSLGKRTLPARCPFVGTQGGQAAALALAPPRRKCPLSATCYFSPAGPARGSPPARSAEGRQQRCLRLFPSAACAFSAGPPAGAMTVGGTRRGNYPRRGPAEDEISILEKDEEEEEEEERRQTAPSGHAEEGESGCASKKVVFAVLPDRYEPLGGAEDEQQPKAERKSKKRRRKLKKYGKDEKENLQSTRCGNY